MTDEEIAIVKETGICHEVPLDWFKLDEGGIFENGVEVTKKYWQATCAICQTTYQKLREEEQIDPPVIIDLDTI